MYKVSSTADLEKMIGCALLCRSSDPISNEGDKWAHSDMKCVQNAGEVVGTTENHQRIYLPRLKSWLPLKTTGSYRAVDNFQKQDYTRNKYEWKNFRS